ncbi:MAG: hypothetical protein K0S71_2741 [Clostridia bacterium]|nr:hypothetical protein [Clostridia bacterium]
MDIKWSYYLIGIIYILVCMLRVINNTKTEAFKKQNNDSIKLLVIKKDFFTTVSFICIVVTLFINIAALKGGKPINKASILITLLVIGFTIINSVLNILLSNENEKILLSGYELEKGEIETFKLKERKGFTSYDITFTKEIDSYNYAKLLVFGKNREQFKNVIQNLTKDK